MLYEGEFGQIDERIKFEVGHDFQSNLRFLLFINSNDTGVPFSRSTEIILRIVFSQDDKINEEEWPHNTIEIYEYFSHPKICTKTDLAEFLGVSPVTAGRYLDKAKEYWDACTEFYPSFCSKLNNFQLQIFQHLLDGHSDEDIVRFMRSAPYNATEEKVDAAMTRILRLLRDWRKGL